MKEEDKLRLEILRLKLEIKRLEKMIDGTREYVKYQLQSFIYREEYLALMRLTDRRKKYDNIQTLQETKGRSK
jgi:hypothetical protein